jgi:hypothetical protein
VVRQIHSLDELERLVAETPGVHVRYSEGPDADRDRNSMDTESGLELPGLSVNPLDVESWWTRPRKDWLARQLCQYRHLSEKNPKRRAWVLRGRTVARGPDSEPLVADVEPIAYLADSLLDEAEEHYRAHFDARRGPED